MPQQLPFVPSLPAYRVGTILGGVQLIFDVHWNERDSAWYFNMLADDETPIQSGVKIVLGAALGRRSVHPSYPSGIIMASDLSGERRDAGYDDIGTRVRVYFYSFEELQAL